MTKKVLFYVASFFLIVGCGSNNDCPNGVNTTNPSCAGYVAPQQQYPYPQQQYQQPQACQPGSSPYCVNGYMQYPQQQQQYQQPQACQPGSSPYCVNGYMQYPQQQYPYGYQAPTTQPRYY